jgi:hypothetical protein
MSIRASRFFNDPGIAQAASNLTAMFAPPSGADASGWASANAKREEAARLAQLFEMGATPSERASLTGVQGYGQTPQGFTYNVDQGNLTSRSNNAADNARAIQTNQLDNNRSLLGTLFQPLNQGQVRPELPGDIASQYGMPGVTVPGVAGAPKPLSETEAKAAVFSGLSPELQEAITFGSTPVENVDTPDGVRVATRLDAVGQIPFINPGVQAKPDVKNYRTPDGRAGTAVYDPEMRKLIDTQTGQPLPEGTQTFNAQSQGSVDQVLGTTANNQIERQMIDIAVAKDTAVALRDLIASSPASQGVVGWMRGTAQDLVQTGGELGAFFGGQMQEVSEAIKNGTADAGLAGAFDPNIPAIEMMANLLAFQYAKTTTGERLSNQMLAQTRRALGLEGLTANQASSLTRVNEAIKRIEAQQAILGRARTGGVNAINGAAPTAPPANGMPGQPPVMRFDANGNQVR